MFGSITIHLAEVSKSVLIGGGAGGLLGNLVPHTSPWYMLLIGAAAGAGAEFPNLVKSIVEALTDYKKNQRSSIAYIANFLK